ncbi:MAG TPA: hypothetical protein VE129_19155 [Thermoanaerobaculia bacterium]|nr:hypothetical protein [Thermoanaerobaculia bacterium]
MADLPFRGMRHLLSASLALGLLAVWPGAVTATERRLSIRVDGGRPVEVFRAIPLYRGSKHTLTIWGRGVEQATRVEGGRGIAAPDGGIRRTPDSLEIGVRVDAEAPTGPSELRLRFPIELSGPEVFPAVVLRNGRVGSVDPARVTAGKRVIVTYTGSDLGNADVLASSTYTGARVLPGGNENRCQVELTFRRAGKFPVLLYDRAGLPRPGSSLDTPGGYQVDPSAVVEVDEK